MEERELEIVNIQSHLMLKSYGNDEIFRNLPGRKGILAAEKSYSEDYFSLWFDLSLWVFVLVNVSTKSQYWSGGQPLPTSISSYIVDYNQLEEDIRLQIIHKKCLSVSRISSFLYDYMYYD